MPIAKEGFVIPKGTKKFRMLVGSHVEGVPISETEKQDVVYRAGEYIESTHDLCKIYCKPGQTPKMEEVPFNSGGQDVKRYADPSTFINDPSNPGQITREQMAQESQQQMVQQNNLLQAQIAQLLQRDSDREAKVAAQDQQIAKLLEQQESKSESKGSDPKQGRR